MGLEFFSQFTERYGASSQPGEALHLIPTEVIFYCDKCKNSRVIFVALHGGIVDTSLSSVTINNLLEESCLEVHAYFLDQNILELGHNIHEKYMLAPLLFYICVLKKHDTVVHGKK